MKIFKSCWPILVFPVLVFLIGIIPSIFSWLQFNATFYYGSLFFTVLLASSATLLFLANPHSANDRQERDHRVIHFELRIAFALAIGAIIIAALFLVAVLGFVPALQPVA